MEYVGIDLHKRECQVCILDEEGAVLLQKRVKTTPEALSELLVSRARGSKVLLESSTESEWVARLLEKIGFEVVVADPSFEPMYLHRHRRVKTDRRDARMLADALRFQIFRRAHRKSTEQRHVASQLAVRSALVRSRVKFVVIAQALVRGAGLRVAPGSSEKFLERLAKVPLSEELSAELAPLVAMLPVLNKQIEAADVAIEQVATKDARLKRLMSVPGVGPITAATFLSVIDDATRFKTSRQLSSYVGLVPREYSSGEKSRRGSITKAGQGELRSLLVQTALRVRRIKGVAALHLRAWSDAIGERRSKKVAIVALARRLATILFAILRDGTMFHVPSPPASSLAAPLTVPLPACSSSLP